MKAFVVTKYKGPLQESDVPEPVVGERDVLVRVEAAGLNQLDEKIRTGEFKQILPYRLPLILATTSPASSSRSGRRFSRSNPATKYLLDPTRIASEHSRSVSQ